MEVAVTGATGFIGQMLVETLIKRGDQVRVLSRHRPAEYRFRESVSAFHADLTSPCNDDLAAFVDGVDVLYHAAGNIKHIEAMHDLHVVGTGRLIAASGGKIGRWVQLSSVGVYGPVSSGVVTEETPLNPVGPYECTKCQSDELVLSHARDGAFQCTILRPSNVFGPNMTNQSLFQLIETIRRRRFVFIGKKGASANYIAVDNVVDAMISCGTAQQSSGRVYNISDYLPIETFIAAIADALGVQRPRIRLPELPLRMVARALGGMRHMPLTESRVNALVNRCIYSNERIEKELGYAHRVSMEDCLLSMVKTVRGTG